MTLSEMGYFIFLYAIALYARSVIRNKKGRSLLMREGRSVIRNNKGRSVSVESSYSLVFGVKGDRSFILGDRNSCNHRTGMVEMDKIVSKKEVGLIKGNPTYK
ncbi:MAG: hypothetical protein QQW96_07275 [Tychonema bourrellyi B0820]|uniref:Uncharacterized protein n=1 Tax=Tychonema bourrellyi FEM_GT703 TaxID=2040638 RepID=A0A2G4EYL3_9CYAN|nr:hypothetical protein [Tychonema bourrellyi]MDQ2097431.1 hypothetical protein [Tychonema bourrellyi B0820]PHX54619.1 hypothetical protein CP500_015180 [Tychonema bourrellyi FEM_GT703]